MVRPVRTAKALGAQILLTFLMAAGLLAADMPGVDMSGLTPEQKATAEKLLATQDCSCRCGMKISECQTKDPACNYSKGLAQVIVDTIKKGGSEQEAIDAAAHSKYAQGPPEESSNKLMEDPVAINTKGSPVIGPSDAKVTLVEFSDFQCPYCVAAVPQLHELLKMYPTQVKLIFKQYPLDNHSQAAFAALASLAAQKQGKFWPMHDALFAKRGALSHEIILSTAKEIGLDMNKFEADLKLPELQKTVALDVADGDGAGVEGTPTLFIDGQRFNGPLKAELLKQVLDQKLSESKTTTTARR